MVVENRSMASDKDHSILIVDDEESICLLYQAELDDRGYSVRVQTDGTRAMEDIERFHPDLVILDIKMPGADGLEILDHIKSRFPDIDVILNSAYGSFRNEASARKADGYVIKSSDMTDLLKTIEKVLA